MKLRLRLTVNNGLYLGLGRLLSLLWKLNSDL